MELRHIAKAFGAVIALTNGTLRLDRGSIHALVGENGAGKSTLVKIVAGLYQRDAGDFLLDGESVDFRSTAEAKAAGIAVIYISHRLREVIQLADQVTVLRDGRLVETRSAAGITAGDMIRLMVGRDLTDVFPKT
ncbi:ATP-binding cassette domain-containing protein, partial [Robbsia andropogonis]